MSGIPSDLNKRIREALLNCGPFDDPQQLRGLFSVNAQLSQWQFNIPGSATTTGRVDALIAFLYNKPYDKPNPLITFLYVLSEDATGGCRQQLQNVTNELAEALGEESPVQSISIQEPDTGSGRVKPSVSVSHSDIKELYEGLLEAFNSDDELRHLVRFYLDEKLQNITGNSKLPAMILDLVEWTERRGRAGELICAAAKERPLNKRLQELSGRYCQ